MDFAQEPKKRISNEKNYHLENLHLARAFSKEIILEMKDLVRSVVLFGSTTNDTSKAESDVDILIILDNISVFVTPELKEAYKIITEKISKEVAQGKVHLMTLNLTDFWDLSRTGDALLVSILRSGVCLFDRDLFEPMQYLLEIGKIKPSREAVINYLVRSETLYEEHKNHLFESVLDLYYAVIDSSHALLMSEDILPESPKKIPSLLKQHFTSKEYEKCISIVEELYDISKQIEHKNLNNFKGKDYDALEKKVSFCLEKFSKKIRLNINK